MADTLDVVINKNIEKVSFSIGAGLINRLGKELVGRAETAVSELIKNSYDADSTLVELIYKNTESSGGTLLIEDNGLGMNKEQLLKGFMRIASTDKVENPTSLIFKRGKAGKKGIGRFATQRLGEKLTIITQTKVDINALKITINWNEYDNIEEDLTTVGHTIEIIPKQKEEGTSLIIENLREGWTESQVRRIHRYISQLLQPDFLSERTNKLLNSKVKNDAFDVRFYYETPNEIFTITDEQSLIFDYAFAVFEGRVDELGMGSCNVTSKHLDIRKENNEIIIKNPKYSNGKFEDLIGIRFKIYYFLYVEEYYENTPKLIYTNIRDLDNSFKGVRLYRNGFRVLPYGDIPSGDDWLGLDIRYSTESGVSIPMNNKNLCGFVEILDKEGIRFEETASREGLIENDQLKDLRYFLKEALQAGRLRIAESQDLKEKRKRRLERGTNNPKNTQEKLKNRVDTPNESENIEDDKDLFKDALTTIEELADEIKFLRVLASLGLTIGEYSHEIKQYSAWFLGDIHLLEQVLHEQVARDSLNNLKSHLKGFETYTDYYGIITSKNTDRKLNILEIRDVVKPFVNRIKPNSVEIKLSAKFNGYDLYTCPMHPSEWGSILLNLFTNAKKAIKKANVKNGEILIKCSKENNKIIVEFYDNGIGIIEEHKERVFNAFFTTSDTLSDNDSAKTDLMGSGLGLHIVKSIIESYEGEIYVSAPIDNYKTCVRIEIPSATQTQIDEYEQS